MLLLLLLLFVCLLSASKFNGRECLVCLSVLCVLCHTHPILLCIQTVSKRVDKNIEPYCSYPYTILILKIVDQLNYGCCWHNQQSTELFQKNGNCVLVHSLCAAAASAVFNLCEPYKRAISHWHWHIAIRTLRVSPSASTHIV